MVKKSELTKSQMEFITDKVENLGSFSAVKKFYNLRDDVSAFAKQLAGEIYNYGIDEEDKNTKTKKKSKKKTKKKSQNVKRKRNIDVEEVLNEE